MTEYIPIFIMDEDDTPLQESFTLREFLEEIDNHVKNVDGATPDNVYVTINKVDYEDDNVYELSIAEIKFSIKK